MPGLANAVRVPMLAELASLAEIISLHTSAGEASGGYPAYRRQRIEWSLVDGNALTNTNRIEFPVPAGTYVSVGYWSSGGTWLGQRTCTPVTFDGQGLYVLDPGAVYEVID